MKIGGWQKFSLIDYPGKLSAVVFTQGCNMRCSYCHNPELVEPRLFREPLEETAVLSFLKERRGLLEGLVVTGGEPTVQPDLDVFLGKVKKLGYQIKLDTNGTNPEKLKRLIEKDLVDHIAMDVKAPQELYSEIAGIKIDPKVIGQSIELVKQSGKDYEFRTTVVAEQLGKKDIMAIGRMVAGAKCYVIQPFVGSGKVLGGRLRGCSSYEREELEQWAAELENKYVANCRVR